VNVIEFFLEFSKILPPLVLLAALTTTTTTRNVSDAKNMDNTAVRELGEGFASAIAPFILSTYREFHMLLAVFGNQIPGPEKGLRPSCHLDS
jgi:hypothetical protein